MHSRNTGLQRLRTATKRVGVAAAVLTGVFAGLAAASNPGKHHRRTVAQPQPTPAPPTTTTTRAPSPPSLPPVGDDESAPAPAPAPPPTPSPPQQPPVQTQAPPAAVSGGS